MEGTKVMMVGALPAGGMPSPGGPIPTVEAPYTQPLWLFNAEARMPQPLDFPMNTMRVTNKGCKSCGPASTGRPITSALAGINSPALGALGVGIGDASADAANGEQVYCTTQAGATYIAATQVGYMLLGATFAGLHGYRRTGSGGWATLWGAFGAFFPVMTGIVALAQGYGKKK